VKYGGLAEKIYGLILAEEEQALGIRILRMIATVVAWSYDKLTIFRNFLFDLRILKVHKLSCPVISVGNLAVGGTGKTPLVIWLARFLLEEGAVISQEMNRSCWRDVSRAFQCCAVPNGLWLRKLR
jgi:hypothetical protein